MLKLKLFGMEYTDICDFFSYVSANKSSNMVCVCVHVKQKERERDVSLKSDNFISVSSMVSPSA